MPRRRLLGGIALGALSFATASLRGRERADASAAEPPALLRRDPTERERWLAMHDAYVARSQRGELAAVLLGDSLTYGWLQNGRAVYERTYAPRRIEPFGIGGDRTADLLWRVAHGELSGPAPRVVVVLIGTNDLASGPDDVIAGIRACLEAIRSAVPMASVLLLGLLPRGDGDGGALVRREIGAINRAIARFDNGYTVRALDIGTAFERADGTVDPALYEPDLLHLSAEGYAAWARAMAPLLGSMLARSAR